MMALYDAWCPKCEKQMWWCNGDENDMTVTDIDSIACPWCGYAFWVNPIMAELLNYDEAGGGEEAFKTPNEAAGIKEKEDE